MSAEWFTYKFIFSCWLKECNIGALNRNSLQHLALITVSAASSPRLTKRWYESHLIGKGKQKNTLPYDSRQADKRWMYGNNL